MKKLALAVAVSAIALSTASAQAATWMGYNFDQAYASVKGGVNSVEDNKGYDFRTGYNANAAVGYSAAQNIRAELEGGWSTANISGGDVDTVTIMANGYYDFSNLGQWSRWLTPYLGVGLGTAHQQLDGQGTSWEFAYQGMAGASYTFNPHMAITAEYRYLGTTNIGDVKYNSHNLLAGLKFAY